MCVIIDSDDDNAVKFYNCRQIAFHRFGDDLHLIKHLTDDENGDIGYCKNQKNTYRNFPNSDEINFFLLKKIPLCSADFFSDVINLVL